MVYYRLGRKGDATFALRRAIQLDPSLDAAAKIRDVLKEISG
jgi:cytochrome c-type biogenesis protein CcmH/NrfG